MSYIGNTNTTQAFTSAIDYFSGNGSTTAFTLSRPVSSVAQVQVHIDNVAQNPSTAFTISSNTITFTSAPLTGTNNIYVQYTSPITQIVAPSDGSVTTSVLAANAVTASAIASNAVTASAIASDAVTTAKILNSNVTPAKLSQPFTSSTSVATTSGTSVDITGIPSWVKRITLMFSGVSLNGGSEVMVQIGTSGGIQTTSYIGKYSFGGSYASISTGFVMYLDSVAGDSLYGTLTLNLFTDSSTGKWIGTGITSSYSGGVACGLVAGEKSLSGVLDRIRVTTLNGTDAFDAGSVNIMYEG